jgi:hypothetical protein
LDVKTKLKSKEGEPLGMERVGDWSLCKKEGTNKRCDDIDDHFKHGHCLCGAQNKYALVNPI